MQKTFNQSIYFSIKHPVIPQHFPFSFHTLAATKKATYISKKELNYNNINQQIYHGSLYFFFNE